ncbi:MAG: hypothetical protein HYV53_04060 [Parcubacteria group bacterium]|nr:hypothetical protein [Parcubacteria group bacterium]
MSRKVSFNELATVLMGLSEEEQRALLDYPKELKKFAGDLSIKIAQEIFFMPLSDQDVREDLAEITVNWRRLATELDYTGPVVWKVKEGFTLKEHAPLAGPCYENFQYLQDWNIQDDESTKNSLVFWVPRLVQGSKNKTMEENILVLAELRQKLELPTHHLTYYGSVSLLSGLILSHFKHTGERTPLNGEWTRTGSLDSDGHRVVLGDFDACGLDCDDWPWDGYRNPYIGCFPLGVDLGA